MKRVWKLALLVSVGVCIAAWSGMAAAESEEAGLELQTYFSNANTTGGQAFVNIVAPLEGNETGSTPAVVRGETCAMIYVFDTAQNLQSCCGCPVTADGLLTLQISVNLAPNVVGSEGLLMDGSIRILSTLPNATPPLPGDSLFPGEFCDPAIGVCCDPAARLTSNVLTLGSELAAWASHIQGTQITESEFLIGDAVIRPGSAAPDSSSPAFDDGEEVPDPISLPEACADITQLGSGAGVCTCPLEGSSTTGPT